jgi:hypothetical protein
LAIFAAAVEAVPGVTMMPNQLCRQRWQLLATPLRPAVVQ